MAAQNVYLKGVIEAGSGTVTLGDSGININEGENGWNKLTWLDSGGHNTATIFSWASSDKSF